MTGAAIAARSRSARSFECPACGVHSALDWRMVGYMVANQGMGWIELQTYHLLSEEVYEPLTTQS